MEYKILYCADCGVDGAAPKDSICSYSASPLDGVANCVKAVEAVLPANVHQTRMANGGGYVKQSKAKFVVYPGCWTKYRSTYLQPDPAGSLAQGLFSGDS